MATKITYSQYQKDLFKEIETGDGNIIVQAVAGSGKCLKKGEKVIMLDGSFKCVEDIKIGDKLISDDYGKYNNVLSLTKGYGKLYRIKPIKGKSFVVNEDHILTLINTNSNKIIDVKVKDIILNNLSTIKVNSFGRYDKSWKLLRSEIYFDEKETSFDPYLIGLWLGDGSRKTTTIYNPDEEIIDWLNKYSIENNYYFSNILKDNCNRISITKSKQFDKNKIENEFLTYVKTKCVDCNNCKIIPNEFIYNSKEIRLKLIAGMLDTDGYYDIKKNSFEITLKDYDMIKQLEYMILSVGLYANISIKKVKLNSWDKTKDYYRLIISGDLTIIPTKVKRKQSKERKTNKNILKTGWEIEYVGYGEYYGFQLDGSQRFLTDGFFVTHNSTSLVKGIDYIPKNETILFLAFNKSIVEELKTKVPKNVRVSTLHSIGFNLIRNQTGDSKKPNFNKFNEIFDVVVSKLDKYKAFFDKEHNKRNFKFFIKKLSDLVKSNNINYSSDKELIELMDFYDISRTRYSYSLVKDSIEIICEESLDINKYWVDFSDMIWIPIQLGMTDGYNYIFVDEAQDLNKAQMQLVKNLCSKRTRVFFIGDKNQSILGFAGSNTNSMNDIKNIFNAKEMPLSICYRCPLSHIEEAQRLVPEIEYFDKNCVGTIKDIMEPDIARYIQNTNDMIICRTNAPLVDTCLELVRNGIKAYVKGGDLKQNIMREINLVRDKHRTLPELKDHFNNEIVLIEEEFEKIDEEQIKAIDNAKSSEESEYIKRQFYYKRRNLIYKQDLILTILSFIKKELEVDGNLMSLVRKIDKIFEEDKDAVCCSTIHKAKGLEADNVFLLYPHLLPHPILQGTTEWQQEQEKNVEYVAITRSKNSLIKVWKME